MLRRIPPILLLLLLVIHLPLAPASTVDSEVDATAPSTPKSENYRNFLSCVATCGKLRNTRRTIRLLSGDEVADWETNGAEFDSCKNFCEEHERYNSTARPLESLDASEFDRLEVTCIESVRMKPLRLRAKLLIRHAQQPAEGVRLLHVVEVWRSTANAGGLIRNEMVGRHFTLSDRFAAPVEFAGSHVQERFFVRVHSFTPDGPFGRPLCSGVVGADALLKSDREPVQLTVHAEEAEATNGTSKNLRISWTAPDSLAPPECEQVVQWSTVQRVQTKWIQLDSSHVFPLADINDNLTYLVRLISKRDFNGKINLETTAGLILRGAGDLEANYADWSFYLDGYAGLLICTLIVLCCCSLSPAPSCTSASVRREHQRKDAKKKKTPHFSNSSLNLATQQISPSRSSTTNDRDSGVESHKNDKDSWPDVIAVRPAAAFDPRRYSLAERDAQGSPYAFTSTPRRFVGNGVTIVQVPPGQEALV
ncbi:hypothetical protein M3Y99_01819100 [Aphelenchoides fujianensis]|nr:hypothetical protein M3Y99_01819100 [Aphelenchoides fujianensis]